MDITSTKTHSGHMPAITSHLPEANRGLEVAGRTGHSVLWVIFGAMLLSTLLFFGGSLRKQKKDRIFYLLTGFITLFATISYYAMALGLGTYLIPARGHGHAFREIYAARYFDWMATTPLLLLDLGMFAGLAPMDLILLVVFDLLMVLTGYFGAITHGIGARFGFFAMSCVFMLVVFGILIVNGFAAARARGDKVLGAFRLLTIFTIILWTAYPIVWAFSEGLNTIHTDTEIIGYAVLDALAKPVFGILLLSFHAKIEEMETSLPSWFTEAQAGGEHYSILPQE